MLRQRPAAASCIKQLTSCIYSLVNQWKVMLHNAVEFTSISQDILLQIYDVIQSNVPLQKQVR